MLRSRVKLLIKNSFFRDLYLIIKERKGFPAEIFDWSRAEVSA